MRTTACGIACCIVTLALAVPTRAEDGGDALRLAFPAEQVYDVSCTFRCAADHGGIDYALPSGTTVVAAARGTVEEIVDGIPPSVACFGGGGYGNSVLLRHDDGSATLYAHLRAGSLLVRTGDTARAGLPIAQSGASGYTCNDVLHFEVRDATGVRVNPYGDPPDYDGGCGTGALWMTCPPAPLMAVHRDEDGDGYTPAQGDCDDAQATMHPGAIDLCDSIDNDCDGTADRAWKRGITTDLGKECAVGVGECQTLGAWVCAADGRGVACSADPNAPQDELCDGRDNDCDGRSDEDFPELGSPCSIDWTSCAEVGITEGQYACREDQLGTTCTAAAPETFAGETCDGYDNDCDGATDNVAFASLDANAEHCGECFNGCAYTLSTSSRCTDGTCFLSCGGRDPVSLCYEFCRIRHCPSCGLACGEGLEGCYGDCVVDPAMVFGNDYAKQDCACRGCESCCCISSGPFTECYEPCFP